MTLTPQRSPSIAEVSSHTGLTKDTLRWYEGGMALLTEHRLRVLDCAEQPVTDPTIRVQQRSRS